MPKANIFPFWCNFLVWTKSSLKSQMASMKKYCTSKPRTLAKPKLWRPKPQESRSEISFWAVSCLWWPGRHSTAWTKRLTLHSATEKVTLKKKSQEGTQLKGLQAPVHFFNFPLRAAAAGLGSQGLGVSVARCQGWARDSIQEEAVPESPLDRPEGLCSGCSRQVQVQSCRTQGRSESGCHGDRAASG